MSAGLDDNRGGQDGNELVVSEATGLRKAVHSSSDLDIYVAAVEQLAQIVLIDDAFRQHVDWDAHVFVACHGWACRDKNL